MFLLVRQQLALLPPMGASGRAKIIGETAGGSPPRSSKSSYHRFFTIRSLGRPQYFLSDQIGMGSGRSPGKGHEDGTDHFPIVIEAKFHPDKTTGAKIQNSTPNIEHPTSNINTEHTPRFPGRSPQYPLFWSGYCCSTSAVWRCPGRAIFAPLYQNRGHPYLF